jgi:ComEC/Rec2-related protein
MNEYPEEISNPDHSLKPLARRPVVRVVLILIAGLILGLNPLVSRLVSPVIPQSISILLFIVAGWKFYAGRHLDREPGNVNLLLSGVLFLIGMGQGLNIEQKDRALSNELSLLTLDDPVIIEGVIEEEPHQLFSGTQLVINEIRIRFLSSYESARDFNGRVALTVKGKPGQAMINNDLLPVPGQRVRAWGRVRSIYQQTRPSIFDSVQYWKSRNVNALMSVWKSGDLEIGEPPNELKTRGILWLRHLREHIDDSLSDHLSPASMPLARSLLLGQAHRMSPDHKKSFQVTGLAHLLAVSGLHTGLVMFMLLGFLRSLQIPSRAVAWLGIFGLIAYSALTGFRPPVVRASIMGTFFLFGFATGRISTSSAALATSALFTLCLDPRNILRIDWQFSYICLLSIILFHPTLSHCLLLSLDPGHKHASARILTNRFFIQPFCIALAVYLGLTPLQLYYFQQVNILAPLASIIGTLLVFISIAGMMLTILFNLIPFAGTLAGMISSECLEFLQFFSLKAAGLDQFIFYHTHVPEWMMTLYYGSLFGFIILAKNRWDPSVDIPEHPDPYGPFNDPGVSDNQTAAWVSNYRKRYIFCSLVLICILTWQPVLTHSRKGFLDFYMLDVGQGDGMLIHYPDGKAMVIDTGNAHPVNHGRTSMEPLLTTLG